MSKSPDFLYIGPSKAGSTWLFKLLCEHPQIYMYPDKNLGFFSTRFDKGWDWYREQFNPDPQHRVVGEVSHSYLVAKDAPARISSLLPEVKLVVCLREPVERTFSDYLDGIKNGKAEGSFEDALQTKPSLIEKSRYGKHIANYLGHFDRAQIHIASFDQLRDDPTGFARSLFDFLGVDQLEIPAKLHERILPGGIPRFRPVATVAKRLSRWGRQAGLRGLKGKLKTSKTIRNLLYKPFTKETRPAMKPETRARLRGLMAKEVRQLDSVAGTKFAALWGYDGEPRVEHGG